MLYLSMDILTDKYKHQQNCIQYSIGYMANFRREILTKWSNKSINKFITEELINRPEINDKSFFDGMFLFVSPSIKYLLMNCECKYRWKFLSIKLLNLAVLNDDHFYIFFSNLNWISIYFVFFICMIFHLFCSLF